MGTRIASQNQSNHGENERIKPVCQTFMQFRAILQWLGLKNRVILVRIDEVGQVTVFGIKNHVTACICELAQVKSILIKFDDGNIAGFNFPALNLTIIHQQNIIAIIIGDSAIQRIINQIRIGIAGIGDEHAADAAV